MLGGTGHFCYRTKMVGGKGATREGFCPVDVTEDQ